jgi:hypothetical protein
MGQVVNVGNLNNEPYTQIFELHKSFKIKENRLDETYQYRPNKDKGEFINEEGQVVAQLLGTDIRSDWFSISGIFMGHIFLRAIEYKNIEIINN